MNFNVYYNENLCGIISTYEQDMFVVFDANCDIVSLDISRVFLKNGEFEVNLGVLMPKNGRYILKKKLPKAYVSKISLDNSFEAFIQCENDDKVDFNILRENIFDKNLGKCICKRISKLSFANYDCYSFSFDENSPFLFDFCPTLCEISQNRIILKTDKNGRILTK
ncbi:MAG: hypothetical protein R3Y09_08420 [Clostridia bacterium]